jgi:hypothetical protein
LDLLINHKNEKMEKLELFAVVELFGHNKMAGRVSEQSIGVATFIRIDVPETDSQPKFTRLLNPSAIYAINPVTEEVANYMAHQIAVKPIESWDIREMQKKLLALKGPDFEDDDDELNI